MASAEFENGEVIEVTEKNDKTGPRGVEKQKQNDVLLIEIKKRTRNAKTKSTKLRHELERLCLRDSEITDIKSVIQQLRAALEDAQEIFKRS